MPELIQNSVEKPLYSTLNRPDRDDLPPQPPDPTPTPNTTAPQPNNWAAKAPEGYLAAPLDPPMRALAKADDLAKRERRKLYLRAYHLKNREREREQAHQYYLTHPCLPKPRREQRQEVLRLMHPLDLTREEAMEVDRLVAENQGELFRLTDDHFDLEDIIDTRVTEDDMAEGPQPLTRRQALTSFWTRIFNQQKLTLEDTEPQRIAVAWRIVRELARIKGRVTPDQTLAQGLSPNMRNPDPWAIPETFDTPAGTCNPPLSQDLYELMLDAESFGEDYQYTRYNHNTDKVKTYNGLAFLPPPVPIIFLDMSTESQRVSHLYDPRKDFMLCAYIRVIARIAGELNISGGSLTDTDAGTMGLIGLLRPDTIRIAFPTKMQIMTYEGLLIQKTANWIIHGSVTSTADSLKYEFGFRDHEVKQLIRMARKHLQGFTEGDVEEDRSIMLLRLEDYIKRSKQALDLNSEMKAMKQMSIILGLAKLDSDDEMAEFVEMVRNVAHEKREKHAMLEVNASVKQLPSGE